MGDTVTCGHVFYNVHACGGVARWKNVLDSVHTIPWKFENANLFLYQTVFLISTNETIIFKNTTTLFSFRSFFRNMFRKLKSVVVLLKITLFLRLGPPSTLIPGLFSSGVTFQKV